MVDHVAQGIQTLLNRVVYLVVHRTDMFGHTPCRRKVGRILQTDGEGVQLGPPRRIAAARLDTLVGILLGHGRDDRRIETAREQYTVGHVRHQLTAYGILQRRAQSTDIGRIVLNGVVRLPVAVVPALHLAVTARPVVPRQEGLDGDTYTLQSLQFRGGIEVTRTVPADVERNNAYRVASDKVLVMLDIV